MIKQKGETIMWFKRIAYATTSAAILLLTPVAAHADCYSDCMEGCRARCANYFVTADLLNACESGCGTGCSGGCDNMQTTG